MTQPEELYLEANGLKHHALVWNPGGRQTVLLCHGWLDIAWSWRPIAAMLAHAGHRVVALDWRGHGESDWSGAGTDYRNSDYLLDLHVLWPDLTQGPVHLVGHSMGGHLCSRYAGVCTDRMASLVVVEGLGWTPQSADLGPDMVRAWLAARQKVDAQKPRVMATVAEALDRMRHRNPEVPEALGLFLAEKSTKPGPEGHGLVWRFDPRHYVYPDTPFLDRTYRPFLERIAVPTLVVYGDRGYKPPTFEERFACLRQGQRATISDAGHMVHWDQPELLGRTIGDFIASVPVAPAS